MRRRTLVGSGITACGIAGLGAIGVRHQPALQFSFYLAGVRFNEVGADPIASQTAVTVVQERWNGKPAYSVSLAGGDKLGFVPASVALQLAGRQILSTHLAQVDTYAVPWKRYRVTLTAC